MTREQEMEEARQEAIRDTHWYREGWDNLERQLDRDLELDRLERESERELDTNDPGEQY